MPSAIAGIGAIVAAGVTGSALPASLAWMGVFYGTQAAIYAGIGYGLHAGAQALNRPSTGRAGSPNFGGDEIYNTSSTIYPIPIGYGKFKMGGNIIRKRVFGTLDNRLHMVVGLCEGVVEGIGDPDLNDKSWLEMTRGVPFDHVVKYCGTDSQEPDHHFLAGTSIGTWAADTFTLSTFSITEFASEGPVVYEVGWLVQVEVTTSAAHYFQEGDSVLIAGTTNYNGTFTVSGVSDSTHFSIYAGGGSFPGNDATGNVRSARNFKVTDVNSYFVTNSGFYLIITRNSALEIVCSTNGAGVRGSVDRTKKHRLVYGTWTGNIFTRNSTGKKGRRFKYSDEDGFFETDDGEWAISAVSEDKESITCSGAGHAGLEGRVDENGFSQAYRGLAYVMLQIKASNKLYGDVIVTTVIEGKKCLCQGRPVDESSFEYTITGGMKAIKRFYIAENAPDLFPANSGFYITGSTSNDGYYTVISALWDGVKTVIRVNESIPVATWDGEIINYKYSNNPGVIIRDFLITKVGVAHTYIDDTSFNAVIDYCNEQVDSENRYELDILVDEQKPIMDILEDMLTSFGGALIYSEAKLKLLVEKSEGADSYDFTESNIVENSLSFWRPEEHINRVKITYLDSSADYRSETIVVEDEDDVIVNGALEKEISAPFITRTSHASRFAQMLMDKATGTDFLCRLSGGYASSKLEVFDVVSITHSLAGWSSKRFRVLNVDRHEDGTNSFLLEAYNGNIYHDKPAEVQVGYYSSLPSPALETELVENLVLTEKGYTNEDGTWMVYIEVTFDDILAQNWKGANVYISIDSEATFELVGLAGRSPFRIWNMRKGDTVYVRVVSVTISDNEGDFIDAPTDSIVLIGKHSSTVPGGENEYPSNITGFGYAFDGQHCRLYWNSIDTSQLQNADLAGYEIRKVDTNWGTDDSNLVYRGKATTFIIENPGAADAGGPFYIRAFNTSGIYSNSAVSQACSNSTPSGITGLTYSKFIGGVKFRWTPSTARDHKDYKVRFKVDNGSGGSWGSYFYIDDVTYTYKLSAAEVTSWGSDAHIYIDVADRDIYSQVGSNSTASEQAEKMPDALLADWSMDIPILDGIVWSVDGAGVDYTTGTLTYKGEQVTVSAGNNITEKYIYADLATPIANPLTLSKNNSKPAIGQDIWLFAYHDDSVPAVYPVYSQHIMHAGVLQADSITADLLSVSQLSAISANIGTITTGFIGSANDYFDITNKELLITKTGDSLTKTQLKGGYTATWENYSGSQYVSSFIGQGYLGDVLTDGVFSGRLFVCGFDDNDLPLVIGNKTDNLVLRVYASNQSASPLLQRFFLQIYLSGASGDMAKIWVDNVTAEHYIEHFDIKDCDLDSDCTIDASSLTSGVAAIARLGLSIGLGDIKLGTYTGDGVNFAGGGKTVVIETGWEPDILYVFGHSDAHGMASKTNTMGANYAKAMNNRNYKDERCTFVSNGFKVYDNATEPDLNNNGTVYSYIAIRVQT